MVPEGWREAALAKLPGDCGRPVIKAGPFGSAIKKENYVADGFKVYGQEQVISGNERYGDYFIDAKKYGSLKSCSVESGDILLSLVGTFGKVLLLSPEAKPGIINPRLLRISVDRQLLLPEFLACFLSSEFAIKRFSRLAQGGTMGVVNAGSVGSIVIPIPSFSEQTKIAEILSTWDKAIETTEKLLANTESQNRALTQQLLTGKRRMEGAESGRWRAFRLDELADINPRTDKSFGESVTFLPMEAVSNSGKILTRYERNVADQGSGYTVFKEGDVLVAKITPCFENGKGCHATGLISGIGLGSTEFHVLRAHKRSDQRLLFHIVNSYEFRKRGEANMTGSAGQRRVPSDYIKRYTVPLPEDVTARETIGSVMDNATKIATNFAAEVDRLKAEKRALMQQLLTGKRRLIA